ncbi:hippurate hydrolase [Amaricoccus macauensis]|uniref:Hippurate hydrolase n=1 Tax=Amaricoccus macauensis TaxID=57001 RepID=A0A840SQ53_9RHOB|nr:hippurate hydrolase [Amaricoccus macauensis]
MAVINRFAELAPAITAWRRDIHAHPEILFDTHRTSGLVAEKLRGFGVDEVVEGIGRTGVVGVIRGRETGSGHVIGLRADMDALPMPEATGLDYASQTPGAMHACGHDGHTAMLLGAAQYLAETRNFDGTVVVIFQPAEEGGGGGREMVEDGLMDRFGIQRVYGMHNLPGLAVGAFAFRPGPIMASSDTFSIVITGRGGHGAMPHTGIDPVVTAAQMITALQQIASRNTDPLKPAVVSVTSLRTSSNASNVIPEEVELIGTARALDGETQDLIERRMGEVVAGIAAAHGASARFTYDRDYPVTANHPDETAFAASVAREVVGAARVDAEAPPMMGAEDFSFMLNERPGAIVFVGNGDTAALHHSKYDFNDEVIPVGCSYWVRLVETAMPAA